MSNISRRLERENRDRGSRLNIHALESDEGEAFYDGIGAELKAERLRCGLSLDEVSARLRIREAHLAAIEAGRFGDLPGRIYAIGFVRSYAEFLGADGDVCISMFKDEVGPGGHSRKLVFPVPMSENRRPGLKTLVASVLLAGLVYAGWFAWQEEEITETTMVPEVPSHFVEQARQAEQRGRQTSSGLAAANAAEAPAPAATPEPERRAIELAVVGQAPAEEAPAEPQPVAETAGAPSAEPTPETPIAEETTTSETTVETVTAPPAPPEPVRVETSEPPQVAAIAAPPPVPEAPTADAEAPRVFGIANRDSRVLVRATGPVQIIVKRLDGSTLLPHRVMKPGDIYRAPNRRDVLLEADNIGNLQLIVDGKLIGRGDRLTEPGIGLALNPDLLKSIAN